MRFFSVNHTQRLVETEITLSQVFGEITMGFRLQNLDTERWSLTYVSDRTMPKHATMRQGIQVIYFCLHKLWLIQKQLTYHSALQPGFPCYSSLHSQVQLPGLAVEAERGCHCTHPAYSLVIRQSSIHHPLSGKGFWTPNSSKVTSPTSITRSDTDWQGIASICILCGWKNIASSI